MIAREELHEDKEKIEDYLKALKEWIEKSPHLKARTDDQFLVAFLRGCQYSLEATKKKLDTFYTLRTHIPELLSNRDPMDIKLREVIKLGIGIPLPLTETPGSPRIFLIRHGIYDANMFTLHDVMKVSTMINDILLRDDDNFVVAGQIGILDLSGVSFKHFAQYNPGFIKKMTLLSHDGSPIRHRAFHYINTPPGFDNVFTVFMSLMNETDRNSVSYHDLESLFKIIPRRIMPFEYGGEAGPLQEIIDDWEKKILSYRMYFQEDEEQFGVDESKRIDRSNNAESLFGAEGSFNQLNFY
ncbi:CLUMA_CG000455, isoform A [Clunio marinus]|uniref:CLUMA_CG000455, isoform A n=1 Tax=Clunio marinus TaxID=568069 RepID=A0A1J1HGE9_9DIPT|nr:CLUMA_CG000455, isoform A [Clunio marinus]